MNSLTKNTNIKKIQSEINDLKKSLINYQFQKSTGQLEKTAQIRKAKKSIARLKTKINAVKGDANA